MDGGGVEYAKLKTAEDKGGDYFYTHVDFLTNLKDRPILFIHHAEYENGDAAAVLAYLNYFQIGGTKTVKQKARIFMYLYISIIIMRAC